MENTIYEHYIAIDWSIKNMAIARITKKSSKIKVLDLPSDLSDLQAYLENLKGSKILVMEETTVAQWLYTELKEYVDKLVVCDPWRNRLLIDGPKTDKIDAVKLVKLLKARLIKEVYHSSEEFLYLRRLVSGYEDLVKAGVRLKNQRYSLLRACGKTGEERRGQKLHQALEDHVLSSLERQIELYEAEKKQYEKKFTELAKKYPAIRHQKSLPGIDKINAVKIVAQVVSPHRFSDKGHYMSYAGLIKLDKISGGKSYGKKNSRYSRQLKSVYKTAAITAINGHNPIHDYYEYLRTEKNYTDYNARHKICRHLANLSLAIFKHGKKYQPFAKEYRRRSDQVENRKAQDVHSGL